MCFDAPQLLGPALADMAGRGRTVELMEWPIVF